ncbi:MAG: hypothetical protein U0165_10800 [Polyangiaceae bacterium]
MKQLPSCLTVLLLGLSACSGSSTSASSATPRQVASCPVCEDADDMGKLASSELKESSGIAKSKVHPDTFWVHNDSGDSARIFAINGSGDLLATIKLGGATALDYEDIAVGPCGTRSCVYVADIGDNLGARDFSTIYWFEEPDSLGDTTLQVKATKFQYSDGPHNAETLLVHPKTGAVYVVTKEPTRPSAVFEIPLDATATTVVQANKLGELQIPTGSPLFTGGDIDTTGVMVILRTYDHVLAFPIPESEKIEDALSAKGCELPAPPEVQGEAVGFDGKDFWTVSEGQGANLYRSRCTWTP